MSKALPFLKQGNNLIIHIGGVVHTISRDTHMAYDRIIEAIKKSEWDKVATLIEQKAALVTFSHGKVSIIKDVIHWDGKPMHDALSTRMLSMFTEGFDIKPMIRFMENLHKNPSARSVEQLYSFLERNTLPITDDGCFLAYKKVRTRANGDMYDIHSNTIRNNVGDTPSMPRNRVNNNPDQTCSYGLHFCSMSYLGHFGSSHDPIVVVKVNPADVVSVPTDYNGAKARCCKYEVVEVVKGKVEDAFGGKSVVALKKPKTTVPTASLPKGTSATWPFPAPANVKKAKATIVKAPAKATSNVGKKSATKNTYRLVRTFNNSVVEYTGLSLADAKAQRQKNISGKKAQLTIINEQTGKAV